MYAQPCMHAFALDVNGRSSLNVNPGPSEWSSHDLAACLLAKPMAYACQHAGAASLHPCCAPMCPCTLQEDVPRLSEWLSHVRIDEHPPVYKYFPDEPHPRFEINVTDDMGLFRARLSLLRAVRLVSETDAGVTLHVPQMTEEVMIALSGLPAWGRILTLWVQEWPLPAAAYRQLAQHVPVSFREWRREQLPDSVLDSMCEGINERRGGLGLKPMVVLQYGIEREEKRGQHVILKWNSDWF